MPKVVKDEINSKGLTAKQERFCREYIIDFNATQAAIRAGYSEKTAAVTACENLIKPNIAAYIKELKEVTTDKLELTSEMIVAEWMKLAFSNIADLHNTWIELKDFELLTPDQKAAIESIETKVLKKNIGTNIEPEIVDVEYVKIKLHSKTKALEELGKFKGIYKEDNEQKKTETPILTNLTYEQLKELVNSGNKQDSDK